MSERLPDEPVTGVMQLPGPDRVTPWLYGTAILSGASALAGTHPAVAAAVGDSGRLLPILGSIAASLSTLVILGRMILRRLGPNAAQLRELRLIKKDLESNRRSNNELLTQLTFMRAENKDAKRAQESVDELEVKLEQFRGEVMAGLTDIRGDIGGWSKKFLTLHAEADARAGKQEVRLQKLEGNGTWSGPTGSGA